jgi:hypothetical protein
MKSPKIPMDNIKLHEMIPRLTSKRDIERTYTLISKRLIKIHPSLQDLSVSLRTVIVSVGWKLDKQQTSHDDILDAFRSA